MFEEKLSRRAILAGAAALVTTPAHAQKIPVQVLAFDGFPIFDPRPIGMLARTLFPARGDALASAWASKLFADTWLVTAGDMYQDFATLADASLRFAADSLHLDLGDEARRQLVDTYANLGLWPDVAPALDKMAAAGMRLAILSNLGEDTLRANLHRAGIEGRFEAVLSTDRVRRYKPAPIAYRMAVEAFGLPADQIGFVAFGGWDAVGATWFGYKTAWINRLGAPDEHLNVRPAIVTPGIEGALRLAGLD